MGDVVGNRLCNESAYGVGTGNDPSSDPCSTLDVHAALAQD